MLFPSISTAVIDYTCITPVSEYSKSIFENDFPVPVDSTCKLFCSLIFLCGRSSNGYLWI